MPFHRAELNVNEQRFLINLGLEAEQDIGWTEAESGTSVSLWAAHY